MFLIEEEEYLLVQLKTLTAQEVLGQIPGKGVCGGARACGKNQDSDQRGALAVKV